MFLVFVDARPVEMAPGSLARDAVAAFDAGLLLRLEEGTAYLTDARGIRLDAGAALSAGAILRVVKRARRSTEADADA
jgi:hypothetical protein